MYMKKALTTLVFALLTTTSWAVNAYPHPITVTQKDGTRLTVIGYGDEHHHYYTTTDGALLFHQGKDFFIARTEADGTLTATTCLAHDAAMRSDNERTLIKSQDISRYFSHQQDIRTKSMTKDETVNVPYFTHTGTPTAVVIMVEFSDIQYTIDSANSAYDQFLNKLRTQDGTQMVDYGNHDQSNYGSVAQYFKDMSSGTFQPNFKVLGPVKLDHPISYYGSAERTDLLIPDACQKAKDVLGTDFSLFDENNDGYIDLVYVVCAGYSEAWGNDTKYIWPRSGSRDFSETFDGKKLGRYGVSTELNGIEGEQVKYIDGIGTFCHEFSHTMGLPDFYVTSSNTESKKAENQAMEEWSLMDAGEYVSNGYCPTAYTAWERAFFGWATLSDLTESKTGLTLTNLDNGGTAYQVKHKTNTNEAFVMQNIQQEGWNRKQRGHGLLVYHVDYDPTIFSVNVNSVNNTIGHPRMTVIPADGLLMNRKNDKYAELTTQELSSAYRNEEAGDVFPGLTIVNSLNSSMDLPNAKWFTDDSALDFSLTEIKEDTESKTVSFNFVSSSSTGIKDNVVSEDTDTDVYAIDGTWVGNDTSRLPQGIYIRGHKKIVVK